MTTEALPCGASKTNGGGGCKLPKGHDGYHTETVYSAGSHSWPSRAEAPEALSAAEEAEARQREKDGWVPSHRMRMRIWATLDALRAAEAPPSAEGLDDLHEAAEEYLLAVTEYLDPTNQFTESRRNAVALTGVKLAGVLSRDAIRHRTPHVPAKCGGCRLQAELDALRAAEAPVAVEGLDVGCDEHGPLCNGHPLTQPGKPVETTQDKRLASIRAVLDRARWLAFDNGETALDDELGRAITDLDYVTSYIETAVAALRAAEAPVAAEGLRCMHGLTHGCYTCGVARMPYDRAAEAAEAPPSVEGLDVTREDAMRARHRPVEEMGRDGKPRGLLRGGTLVLCRSCGTLWPCDAGYLLASPSDTRDDGAGT